MKCKYCDKEYEGGGFCPFCGGENEEIKNEEKEKMEEMIKENVDGVSPEEEGLAVTKEDVFLKEEEKKVEKKENIKKEGFAEKKDGKREKGKRRGKGKIVLLVLLVVLLVIGCIVGSVSIVDNVKKQKELDDRLLANGLKVEMEDVLEEYKDEKSDIEGMTLYDKLAQGLNPEAGSDTDCDGLTDKEEIEVYGSDPLKASTAGDLYLDGYKVKAGMDLHKKYDYTEDTLFEGNSCLEVTLNMKTATDIYAVCEDVTGYHTIKNYEIIKEYMVHSYTGEMFIDLNKVDDYDASKDVDCFLVLNDDKTEKMKSKVIDGILRVEPELGFDDIGYIIVTYKEKATINSLFTKQVAQNTTIETEKTQYLMLTSPLTALTGELNVVIFTDKETANSKEDMERLESYFTETLQDIDEFNVKFTYNYGKGTVKYLGNFLRKIFPQFDLNAERKSENWWFLVMMYCNFDSDFLLSEEVVGTEDNEDVQDEVLNEDYEGREFDVSKDGFCFPNLRSYISPGGNCAGIAHYVTRLFNTKSFETVDSYNSKEDGDFSWDLSKYPEAATLSDRIISDYKSETYFTDKYGDVIDKDEVSGEDLAFVDMIGANWAKGNDVANNGESNEWKWFAENYDYQIIEDVLAKLDQNQVCSVYINCATMGHVMNVYDYYYDNYNKNVLYLKVYDNNFPNDKPITDEAPNLVIKITRKKSLFGDKFEFDYQPLKETAPGYRGASTFHLSFKSGGHFLASAANSYRITFFDENLKNISK